MMSQPVTAGLMIFSMCMWIVVAILAVVKLTGIADMSWWWVISPMLFAFAAMAVAFWVVAILFAWHWLRGKR